MADVGEMPRFSVPYFCLHSLLIYPFVCFPVTMLIDNGLITCLSCYLGNDVSENKHDISLFRKKCTLLITGHSSIKSGL